MELVVAHAFRDEVDVLPVVGRDHGRLREQLALDPSPERMSGRRVLRLHRGCMVDLTVDRVAAERAWVGARSWSDSSTGEQRPEEAALRRKVGGPPGIAGLRACARVGDQREVPLPALAEPRAGWRA